jgi:four helix bundle protein
MEVWQRARQMARKIYRVTNRGAFSKDFVLRDQIRRAAVSVLSNIAEGYDPLFARHKVQRHKIQGGC